MSYIWIREGWLYLAVIPDLNSRRVVALRVLPAKPFRVTAWVVSNRMKRDLAIRALKDGHRLSGHRPSAASSTVVAAANIVRMTIRQS